MSKVSKATQLREKSVNELREEKLQLQRGLFNLRMQKATGQLEKSHQFKESRREIARINTVLGEKEEGGK
ncbi:50S ribosomal protein L29 [Ignatzschineria ureiclastica]|uniref:Large ribosomal subunit protein uL29 n=2 Tax=Ignatzschineria TaxID=112008 RepID=A0A2U2AH18_9GAMM|nr:MULTISPECIES: 50S ribosomal protein L29 [Ignatzschineria]PWD81956.1 50S ribosomal protein L29 [Ignatzschineria ureiclastica]GGZ91663.1 50S ribosomal protein L29 [Ignatzschineria ureiclastica]